MTERISDIEARVDEVQEKKEQILIDIEQLGQDSLMVETESKISEVVSNVEGTIKQADFNAGVIASFWIMVNDVENQKMGILEIYSRVSEGFRDIKKTDIRIPCSYLEYQLSLKYGIPYRREELETILPERRIVDNVQYEYEQKSEFCDVIRKLTLKERNDINNKKQDIQKMQEKVKKNPERYSVPGTITLHVSKDDMLEVFAEDILEVSRDVVVDITEGELIKAGLDPQKMGWKKKGKSEISFDDITRASKKRKGLLSRLFSKDDRDDS